MNFLRKKIGTSKKKYTIFLILIILISLLFHGSVLAQTPAPSPGRTPIPSTNPIVTPAPGTAPTPAATPTALPSPPPSSDCGWICEAVTSGLMHFVGWGLGFIGEIILRIVSLALIISAVLFNMVVQLTVINMSLTITNLQGINIGWSTFRDLANILFIFVLLYIAIATILRLESVNTKKMLTNVVIVALLINFSLFFTKVIIDASNILSAQFYNAISIKGRPLSHTDVSGAMGTGGLSLLVNKSGADNGISDAIMSSMDLTTIFDFKKNPHTAAGTLGGVVGEVVTIFTATLAGSVFILLAACIFLASGMLFIVRFVVLIFLLATSPLAYVGMILPATKQYSQKWWDTLIKECIFAPVYFLMIWLTIKIMGAGGLKAIIPASGTFSELFAGALGQVSIVLNFIIVGTLMVASLLISRNLGARGGQSAFSVFDSVRRAGQGLIGRNTIGDIGRRAEEKLERTQWANNPFWDAIRGGTTRALRDTKYGSGSSRQQAYLHGQELRSKREAAEKADEVREEVSKLDKLEAEYKSAEKNAKERGILKTDEWTNWRKDWRERWKTQKKKGEQRANRLTPGEFAQAFQKEEYMNGNLMNLATFKQVHATDEKREDMNDEEKDLMARALFKRPLYDNLNTWKKELQVMRYKVMRDTIKRALGEGKTMEEARKMAGDDADYAEAGLRDKSDAFKDMHTYIRAMTEGELELLHEVHPELFKDERFMPSVRFLKIQAMRHSGNYTPEEVDSVRFAKSAILQRAFNTGNSRNIVQAIGDHAPSELAGHKSLIRLDPRGIRYYDSNVVAEFINQDTGDIQQVGQAVEWDINRALKRASRGETGEITKATAGVWNWLYNDKKGEGQKFRETLIAKGVHIPDYNRNIDKVTQVEKIQEIDKRTKGGSNSWDTLMGEPDDSNQLQFNLGV